MKTYIERIIRNSSYLKMLTDYYRSDEINYKKVKSYTVSDIDIKNKNLCKAVVENEVKPIHINEIQKDDMVKYLEDTILLYHKNEIYLTELDLKNYEKLHNILSRGSYYIDHDLFQYITNDMNRSYYSRGYNNYNNKSDIL